MQSQFKNTKLRVCKSCGGRGVTWFQKTYPRHGSDPGTGQWDTCKTCAGEMMVRVVIEGTITTEPYNLKSQL